MKTSFSLSVAAGLVLLCAGVCAQEQTPAPADDTRAYFEVLRSKFNADKVATLNNLLKLTPAESEKFWPIYRAYEQELSVLGDRKLEMIREFFKYNSRGQLTDAEAKSLSERWLENLEGRTALWKKYQKKISKALSPIRAAQFLQVENQIALFMDIGIASEMPVVGQGGQTLKSGG